MPVYAFSPQAPVKEGMTGVERSKGLAEGLTNAAQLYKGYQQEKQLEVDMATMVDPNASPLQRSVAAARSGNHPLSVEFLKQENIAQKGKLRDSLGRDIQNKLNESRGIVPQGIQPTQSGGAIPGIGALMNEVSPQNQLVPKSKSEIQQLRDEANIYEDAAAKAFDSGDKEDSSRYASLAKQRNDVADAKEKSEATKYAANVAAENKQIKQQRDIFEADRSYNEKKSEGFQKVVSGLRQTIPRKENAQILARTALESKDLGAFSRDNLANILGRPELRTQSGVALNLAIKENLLTNLSRVSARGTNKWLEQVMIGAFPQTGQSLESNLTAQEAIEAELALDKAQVEVFDRLFQEDMKKQGYVGGDIEQRVFQELIPFENEIRDRTSYRTRILYEQNKDISQLKELSNKKPPKDTPLTPRMFQIMFKEVLKHEKDIEEAKIKTTERAKQLGYKIYPRSRIQEFLE